MLREPKSAACAPSFLKAQSKSAVKTHFESFWFFRVINVFHYNFENPTVGCINEKFPNTGGTIDHVRLDASCLLAETESQASDSTCHFDENFSDILRFSGEF
jgi:hypothetical protein